MTPGAGDSMGRNLSVSMGPLPSSGWPSGLTTRPISASPTGTSTMRPVRLTVSPSLMWEYGPKMTAPMLSSSRLRAMPYVAAGKLQQLAGHGLFQAPHARDAVTDHDNGADVFHVNVGLKPLDLLFQNRTDFLGPNCHSMSPHILKSGLLQRLLQAVPAAVQRFRPRRDRRCGP